MRNLSPLRQRKQRLERRRRLAASLKRVKEVYGTPGLASLYILSINSLKPGTKVVLVLRVSKGEQEGRNNLADQEQDLRNVCAELSLEIVGVFKHTGPANKLEWFETLAEFANYAYDEDAVLLAESTSRFVRHEDYAPAKGLSHLLPTDADFQKLSGATDGVRLATLVDPDAPTGEGEEKSQQIKRGQTQKNAKGGRRRNQPWRINDPVTRNLVLQRKADGRSYRDVSRTTGVALGTVQRWVKFFAEEVRWDSGIGMSVEEIVEKHQIPPDFVEQNLHEKRRKK